MRTIIASPTSARCSEYQISGTSYRTRPSHSSDFSGLICPFPAGRREFSSPGSGFGLHRLRLGVFIIWSPDESAPRVGSPSDDHRLHDALCIWSLRNAPTPAIQEPSFRFSSSAESRAYSGGDSPATSGPTCWVQFVPMLAIPAFLLMRPGTSRLLWPVIACLRPHENRRAVRRGHL